MASVNNFQMIEKERKGDLPSFWRNEGHIENEICASSVFENCLTSVSSDLSAIDLNTNSFENTGKERSGNSVYWPGVEEDADSFVKENSCSLRENESFEDVDETDYFDSEDEYWETLTNKPTEIEPCPLCLVHHSPYGAVREKIFPFYLKDVSSVEAAEVCMFAKENDFEMRDVYCDESCLFRAINDQFMINGCQGHTYMSIGLTAVKQMAETPEKYENPTSSITSGETLNEYIRRIKESGEWSDRVILQALADVFQLRINVFKFVYTDINRTRFTANLDKALSSTVSIFLGQLGESHYFSLRPVQWLTELPCKSQIYRMLATCADKSLEERTCILDGKLSLMSQGTIPGSSLRDSAQYVLQGISYEKSEISGKTSNQENFRAIFKSYTNRNLQFEETDDSQKALIEDQSHIDNVSGIPLCHLTFIMKNILPFRMFQKWTSVHWTLFKHREIYYHYLGSFASSTIVRPVDISLKQEMKRTNLCHVEHKPRKIVILKIEFQAIHINESIESMDLPQGVIVDCSDTLPGYCRLRLSPNSVIDGVEDVFRFGSNIYLKPFKIPGLLHSHIKGVLFGEIRHIGVLCQSFPFSLRWTAGRRKQNFPTMELIDSIIRTGCTLIPKAHPSSGLPEIEWKFNFSMAEFLLFKSLTIAQKHGFYVLKALLEKMIHHMPFKPKNLKNVYLMSCEEIPSSAWEENFGGCVLYVLDALLSCLKKRFLPNYFIPESNLIDSYREDDINTLITTVEYIRLFPASNIQLLAEQYGITYAPNLIKRVVSNIEEFVATKNLNVAYQDLFLPLTNATARYMAKRGFYDTSYDMLEEAFELSLSVPQEGLRQKSVSFNDIFEKNLKDMKQKSSRFNLSEVFDSRTGSIFSSSLKKPVLPLQSCLEWTVDYRLDWLEVPSENVGDLIAISRLLYACSRREYWRGNKLIAELTIMTAIRCINEKMKLEPPKVAADDETLQIKRLLFQYYIQAYFVSKLDWSDVPLIIYMDDIENLCKEFPEMARIVCEMFVYVGQPEKSQQYARMFNSHNQGREHHPEIWVPWE